MRILINVVNARNVGGGLQVVHNFLLGTQKYNIPQVTWYYAVSKCLDEVYLDEEFKKNAADRYFVFPNQPNFMGSYRHVKHQLASLEQDIAPDVIYTILAPSYFSFKGKEVMRFVHPWVVTSNPYAWSTLGGKAKLKMKLHIKLIKTLLKKTNYIITQTEAVKKGLIEQLDMNADNIRVVNNVLPAIYSSMDNSPLPHDSEWVDIPAIGGGEHKNLDIIPEIIHILENKYGIKNYRFHITLPQSSSVLPLIEAKAVKLYVADRIVNHGNMKQNDLALLYRKSMISFLPSVLEVFSASTIEAMYFQLPTVATNLFFNTEVFGDACLYYTPKDAEAAAAQIVKAVTNESLRTSLKQKMTKQLHKFNSFEKYFRDTVDFLMEVGKRETKA